MTYLDMQLLLYMSLCRVLLVAEITVVCTLIFGHNCLIAVVIERDHRKGRVCKEDEKIEPVPDHSLLWLYS
jgi:hypothetical protein